MGSLYVMSLRQLTGRSRLVIIGVLALIPILLSMALSLTDDGQDLSDVDNGLLGLLFGAAVLPIIALTISTAALGNDLEDRTLSNLTLTPFPRWQIILPKFAAVITVAAPPVLISAFVSVSLAYSGDSQAIISTLIGMALAILAYSAVFLWLGLSTGRALGYGLMYVFLWESWSQLVPGIRLLSIRAYMIGVIRGVDDSRFADDPEQVISFPVSLIMLLAIIVVFTALTIRRLRTMDVP